MSKAQTIDFNNAPIADVIQKIEEKTKYRFNYDPSIISPFSYTGELPLDKMTSILNAIQIQTPLQFEQQDSTILVILPKPKMKQICGYVYCESNEEPLGFANLYLKFSKNGLVTDEHGFFKTEIECYDNEPVLLSYVGYENKEIFINSFEDADCPTIHLNPKENLLNIGLIVKDYILPSVEEGKTNSSISLNYKRMTDEENFLDSDVFQNVQILPGVISFDESSSNLSIRGNDPGHCITRWENIQLYNTGHFFGMLSAINPYIVDEVQVYKSSFHPSLGNTIGGVVDISLSDKIAKKFSGGVGLDMTKAFSYLNTPFIKNKLSLQLSAQYSINNEWINSPTLNSYGKTVFQNTLLDEDTQMKQKFEERTETEIQFYDVQAKLNYKPNQKWSVNTSFFKSNDTFEYESTVEGPKIESDELITTNSTAIQTEVLFKPNLKSELKGFVSYSDYINTNGFSYKREEEDEPFDENKILNGIESYELGLQYQLKHHKHWRSDFSINAEYKYLFFDIKEQSFFEDEDIDERDMDEPFFIHQDVNTNYANNNWMIDIGFRNTWFADINEFFFSPRANIQYKVGEAFKLKASAGWYYQFISQLTKFNREHIDNNPIWYINAYHRDEVLQAKKISIGSIFKQGGWLVDVEAYLQKTNNLPGISTLINSERPIDFFGEGFARGIDLMVHKKWKTLTLWTNYTLSKNEFTFTEINDEPFPTSNDSRHNLSLHSSYKYKNWQWAINYHFRTALPYTSIMDRNNMNPKGLPSQLNNLRLPGNYSRLDAAISYNRSLFNKAIQFNTRLSILNLLDKENYESIEFRLLKSRNGGSTKPDKIENYLLGITPQLTFHFSW